MYASVHLSVLGVVGAIANVEAQLSEASNGLKMQATYNVKGLEKPTADTITCSLKR